MKVQVVKQDFSKVLNLTSRFVSNRSQLPILGNIVLKAQANSLTVMSTNLESSVVAKIGAKVSEEGEIAVPARTLTDIVNNLGQGTVDLQTDKEQLIVNTDTFEGKVSAINTADFPKLPNSIEKGIDLPSKQISNALSKVAFSASVDETRPILTGVLFLFKGKEISFVSSDGFRLSLFKLTVDKDLGEQKLVVPKSAVLELIKLASETEKITIEIKEGENQVVFVVGDVVFSTRTLEGEFPNFEKIIPASSSLKVNLDKNDLIQAVKLASVFAREGSNIAKLMVKKDSLEIDAESSKSGKQKSQVEAKVDGLEGEFEINFNYKFIEEVLNVIDGEVIDINFNLTTNPGVFGDPKNTNFLHLIMPVKIQG
jgi:DNA polymerase-3 subunit beta